MWKQLKHLLPFVIQWVCHTFCVPPISQSQPIMCMVGFNPSANQNRLKLYTCASWLFHGWLYFATVGLYLALLWLITSYSLKSDGYFSPCRAVVCVTTPVPTNNCASAAPRLCYRDSVKIEYCIRVVQIIKFLVYHGLCLPLLLKTIRLQDLLQSRVQIEKQ